MSNYCVASTSENKELLENEIGFERVDIFSLNSERDVFILDADGLELVRNAGYDVSDMEETRIPEVWLGKLEKTDDRSRRTSKKTKKKKAKKKKKSKKKVDDYRKEYVDLCLKMRETTFDRVTKENRENEGKVESFQKEIATLQRKILENRKIIEACRGDKEKDRAKFVLEFDKLLETDKIKDVTLENGVMKVETDTLYCVDPRSKKEHEIGAFRITSDCKNYSIKMKNMTRRVDGHDAKMHAPHVFPQGNLCEGTLGTILPDLHANYEFAAIALMGITFIESVNVEDPAGACINNWPESQRSEEERQKDKKVFFKKAKKKKKRVRKKVAAATSRS